MAEALLKIGPLGVKLVGDETLRLALTIPGMKEFRVEEWGAKSDIEILLDRSLSPIPQRVLHESQFADGRRCQFGIDNEGAYHYTFGTDVLLRHFPSRCVEVSAVPDPTTLRYVLWIAYAMAAPALGAVPIHSSTVVCDGRAVLCLGESGTGKSTHTRLWIENIPGCHLLNDDSPILGIVDGKVLVYGSPWSGKTDCFLSESYPVAGLLRLEQRPVNSIRRLSTVEAFAALQPSCPPDLAHDEHYLDNMVKFLSVVITQVPVYRMGCLPNADAAQLSHSTLFYQAQ